MWKKIIYCSAIGLFFCNILSVRAVELDIKSEHAILINRDENKVLYEKNSESITPMASLTKLMTAIIVVEHADSLDTIVTIERNDLKGLQEANAAVAGFRAGQNVTIRDLLYGLLLPSGADAANALTRVIASDEDSFVNLMNEKAKSMGLTQTHFVNATGLDAENHYSTAKEIAILFEYALQKEELNQILSSKRYTMSDSSFSVFSTITKNINQFKLELDYLNGGKTGTTSNAGLCLASMATYGETNYLLVTIRAPQEGKKPNNFYDAKIIYDYFIENYETQEVRKEGETILTLTPEYTKEEQIIFPLKESVTKYLIKNYNPEDIKIEYLEETPLKFNTEVGTTLGKIHMLYQDEIIKEIPIILEYPLHFDIGKYVKNNWVWITIIAFILLLLLRMIQIARKKRLRRKKKQRK